MTFRIEVIVARVPYFHRQPLAGLPVRSRTPSSSSTAESIECHITSNTRTPNFFGIGASHGEACKAVLASEIPCCHRTSIEERLNSCLSPWALLASQ
jgi:hypothetical protein